MNQILSTDPAILILKEAAVTDACRACGCLHAALLEAENADGDLARLAKVLLAGLPAVEVSCRNCAACPPGDVVGLLHGVRTGGCGKGCG